MDAETSKLFETIFGHADKATQVDKDIEKVLTEAVKTGVVTPSEARQVATRAFVHLPFANARVTSVANQVEFNAACIKLKPLIDSLDLEG